MHGDKAKWVPAHLGCNANLRVSPFTTVQVAGGVASGGFRFDKGGAYYLCYRFMYRQFQTHRFVDEYDEKNKRIVERSCAFMCGTCEQIDAEFGAEEKRS